VLKKPSYALVVIDVGPFLIDAHGASNATTQNHADASRDRDTASGQDPDFEFRRVDRVLAVIIRNDGTPRVG